LAILNEQQKRKLFKLLISPEWGLQPYNAAIKAGYPYREAMKLDPLNVKDEKGRWDPQQAIVNIAEQEGFSLRRSIRRMVEKAGLSPDPNVEGANKTISANVTIKSDDPTVTIKRANSLTRDFVDVPDEEIRFKYHKELNEITGYKNPEKVEVTTKSESTIVHEISDATLRAIGEVIVRAKASDSK